MYFNKSTFNPSLEEMTLHYCLKIVLKKFEMALQTTVC